MKRYSVIIASFVSLIVLFVLFSFKTIPSGKLWKGFNVLYVPVETSDSIVQKTFSNLGITEHYEASNQFIPLLFEEYSPEITMLKLNLSNPDYDYLSKRNMYFFDKSNSFRLYYVPSEYKSLLNTCVQQLTKQGVKAGVDGSASYPVFIPIITCVLFVLLCIFSRNKIAFASGGFFGLIYVLCNPFYSCAVSVSLVYLCLFFITSVLGRKGAVPYLLSNFSIPVLLFFALAGSFAGSVKSGFMFIISIAGGASAVFVYYLADKFFTGKRSFIPVLIRPAKKVSLYAGKQNQILTASVCSVLFLLILSVVTSSSSVSTKFAKILIPGASSSNAELVGFEDYYDFVWNVSSYPYRSLNAKSDKNYFTYPHYEEKNGVLVQSNTVKAFNDSFKNQTFQQIDVLPFNAIEKVLKLQGENILPGYCSSGNYKTTLFAIITMLISLCVLLFIYISIIIKKGVKR